MTAEKYLREYLAATHEMMSRHGAQRTLEGEVLAHGKWFTWSPLPDDLDYGEAKNCYGNAAGVIIGQRYLDEERRYHYYEGYGYTPGLVPAPHAWLVDHRTGRLADPTWRHLNTECAFCLGNGYIEEETDDEYDQYDCHWCEGTGVSEPSPDRSGSVYVGIHVPEDLLLKTILKRGAYTFFMGPKDFEALLDKENEER